MRAGVKVPSVWMDVFLFGICVWEGSFYGDQLGVCLRV